MISVVKRQRNNDDNHNPLCGGGKGSRQGKAFKIVLNIFLNVTPIFIDHRAVKVGFMREGRLLAEDSPEGFICKPEAEMFHQTPLLVLNLHQRCFTNDRKSTPFE